MATADRASDGGVPGGRKSQRPKVKRAPGIIIAAVAIGFLLVAAMLYLRIAEAAAASTRPAAERLPRDAAVLARRSIARIDREAPVVPALRARIADGFARSPLIPGAKAMLDPSDPQSSNVGKLSWRQSNLQRRLFTKALESRDWSAAIRHAEAVLRISPGDTEMAETVLGAAKTHDGFAEALGHELAQPQPWADRFLQDHAARLEDEMLRSIWRGREENGSPVADNLRSVLLETLVQQGRVSLAQSLAASRTDASLLPGYWSAEKGASPFDWNIGKGFEVIGNAGGQVLSRNRARSAENTIALLALQPGRYLLEPASAPRGEWQFAFTCDRDLPGIFTNIGPSNILSVPANCDVQHLFLRLPAGSTSGTLPVLSLRRR